MHTKNFTIASGLVAMALCFCEPSVQAVNVVTEHNDNARSGVNLLETTLTTANVNSTNFGVLFTNKVDGNFVFTQPLYVQGLTISNGTHNVVFVGTESNSIYAFDADTVGITYWHTNLGAPRNFACTPAPIVGITGTPVIDLTTGTLYVDARMANDDNTLHALNITNGAEKFGGPVTITASQFGTTELQRPGLLELSNVIYIAYGSECYAATHGFVLGYNATNLTQLYAYNDTPTGSKGAIWSSGMGPAADTNGNIYIMTGNGTFDNTNNLGESMVKLSSSLQLLDWATPTDYDSLNTSDYDFGSGGAVVLPGGYVIGSGKDGVMYMANSSNMGHLGNFAQQFSAAAEGDVVGPSPVFWQGPGTNFIFLEHPNTVTKSYAFTGTNINTTPLGSSSVTETNKGGGISLSANGTNNGILWEIDGDSNLRAYDAAHFPTLLWVGSVGAYQKENCPTIANGKVYVATPVSLVVLGLSNSPPSITTQPASQTNYVGQTATFTVTTGGTAPLSYQWQAGTTGSGGPYTNLSAGGQFSPVTNATLTISSLVATNALDYVVVVSNSVGSITSSVATLTVLVGTPFIITQPASQTNYINQTAAFSVNVGGLAPFSYQWQAGTTGSGGPYTNLSAGGQFSAVTNSTLTISNLAATNALDYVVVVTNSEGSVTSAPATLTVLSGTAPSINMQPASQTNYVGQTNTFTVSASGTAPLSYQWQAEANGAYVNLSAGGQFSGVTNATLTISGLVTNNATNYDVVVTNPVGSITSGVATLTVIAPPSITTQPASQTNYVGQTNTFTVSASGTAPLVYQWQVESNGSYVNLTAGGQFSGVTNATLTISSLALTNATNYDVVVTNSSGSVTSAATTLTVLASSSSYQSVILGDAPVSCWPMQETTGPTIHDIVTTNAGPFNGTLQISTDGFADGPSDGQGKNWGIIHETFTNSTSAVATDGATYLFGGPGGLAGMPGDTAIYFTNLNGQLNNAQIAMGTGGTGVYEAQLDSSIFTAEAWINVPTYTIGWTSNGYQIPLSLNAYGNSGNTANGWFMGVKTDNSGSSAYGEMFFNAGTGSAFASNGPSAQVFSGKWVYAVQEYNGTATVVYTNGTLMVSNTQTYKPLSNASSHELPLIIGSQNAYYFSGSASSGNTRADFWDGGISHVAYYNYALSAGRILAHYQAGSTIVSPTLPTLSIQQSGTNVTVNWTNGFLQQATNVQGPWTDVLPTNETSPQVIPATNKSQFFRATSQP